MAFVFLTGNHDHAAYQEYTILKAPGTIPIPESMSFRQAATLPTAVAIATMILFDSLYLSREAAANSGKPVLIWGGASTVGAMTIQLAHRFGLTVYTTASERHHARLRGLGASVVVDYNSLEAVDDILTAASRAGAQISCAVDAISKPTTLKFVTDVLKKSSAPTKKLVHTAPLFGKLDSSPGVELKYVNATEIGSRRQDLLTWMCQDVLPEWLQGGDIVPQKYRVIGGGLQGLQAGLDVLREGVSGEKLVVEL